MLCINDKKPYGGHSRELPPEDDDPFAFSPERPLRLGGPSGSGSLEASPVLNLGASPRLDLGAAPSLNLGADNHLQPAFLLSVKGKGKERARSASPCPLGAPLELGGEPGGGGFSQFFTQEGVSSLGLVVCAW